MNTGPKRPNSGGSLIKQRRKYAMHTDPIVHAALTARTAEQAGGVQDQIAAAVGARHQRPIGDRWGNQGMLTGSGASYDHKILEVVTNMQDAVLMRRALERHGDLADVPYTSPRQAADKLMLGTPDKEQAQLATVAIDHGTPSKAKGARKSVTVVCRDHGIGMRAGDVPRTIFQIG